MANPQDTGEFEQWVTDRIDLSTMEPKSGNTGDSENWITDRIDLQDYQEAVTCNTVTVTVTATVTVTVVT